MNRLATIRMNALCKAAPRVLFEQEKEEECKKTTSVIGELIAFSGVRISKTCFVLLSVFSGLGSSFFSAFFIMAYSVPLVFIVGSCLPWLWLEVKSNKRAVEFSIDYPAVLLATASSLKAGMNIYIALERAVLLLPKENLLRGEVVKLLERLRAGAVREQVVAEFARDIKQSEVELFRSACLLVFEHGGRFAPTLERLAQVSRERNLLIQSANVSTTNMRMTANALLVFCPIILAMIAVRTENFFQLIIENPLANTLASFGAMMILFSYAVLQKMSWFKP
jgi:Flp pilus assembly protein TadB